LTINTASRSEILGFLQGAFGCDLLVAESICRYMRDRRYPIRAVICRQGDLSETTYLLIAGRARSVSASAEGRVILLQEYLPGDLFGAVAPGDTIDELADVMAIEDLHAGLFTAGDFLRLMEAYNCVGLAVSRMLLRHLRATASRMVEQTTLSATGRIYAELLRLARLGDGQTLHPVPNFSTFAVQVRSTRETVSRTINALERRGLVRREENALVITAPQRLEDMIA
jgi:CRP-like cAMP-binding protein